MDNRKYIFWLVLSLGFYVLWLNLAPRIFPGLLGAKPAAEAAVEDPEANPNVDAPAEPALEPQQEVAEVPAVKPEEHPHKSVTLGTGGYDKGYLMTVELTSKGAAIASLDLNDPRYTTLDRKTKYRLLGNTVEWEGVDGGLLRMPNTWETAVDLIDKQLKPFKQSTRTVNWVLEPQIDADEATFSYTSPDASLKVSKTYRIHPSAAPSLSNPGAYLLDVELSLTNLGVTDVKPVYTLQGPTGVPVEGDKTARLFREVKVGTVSGNGIVPINMPATEVLSQFEKNQKNGDPIDTWRDPVKYAGIDVQYFGALIIPQVQTLDADRDGMPDQTIEFVEPVLMYGDEENKRNSDITLFMVSNPVDLPAGQSVTHTFQMFAGPKRPDLLNPISARDVIQFGNIPFIGWLPPFNLNPYVAHFIMWLLGFLHDSFGLPYALCIIAITIAVRGVMFPLSVRQTAQAERMKVLAPEMKKLQERYKDKPEEYMRALSEFNRKNNVQNPLIGCLPMLLQMPVFFGLYGALGQAVDLRLARFMWIDNLAGQDAMFHLPFTVPWFGWTEFNLLPILAVTLFIVQAKVMTPPPTSEDQEFTQKMQMAMMLAIGFAFYTVPAGLCLYIICSSGWGLAERFLIKRFWPHIYDQKLATADDSGSSGSSGGGGTTATPREPTWFEKLLAVADEAKQATAAQNSARGESNRKKKPKRY